MEIINLRAAFSYFLEKYQLIIFSTIRAKK